jgi:leucyl aminopeptidase
MEFTAQSLLTRRNTADILVLPFFHKKNAAQEAADFKTLHSLYEIPLEAKDFTGKEAEVQIVYCRDQPEKRIALLGLGEVEKVNTEKLRRAYAALTKACHSKKIKSANIVLPKIENLDNPSILRGALEGILLTNYSFSQHKRESIKNSPHILLEKIGIISKMKPTTLLALANKHLEIAKAVHIARDLVNGNADEVTPQYLARVARDLAASLPKVTAKILTKKEIEKEKLGLLLAVSQGSHRAPEFIILSYRGSPKSKEHTVLIGKGVTYDTGGLNLKPTGSMETMKCDMGGAAAVIGTLSATASLGLKQNLTIIIPSTENAMGPHSYKPGDVYISHSGKSIEIGNTDAEGRLILADALSYAIKHLKPTRLIDVATLTGAIDIALGPEASGLFSNNDELADQIMLAGEETYDRVWRMPLFPEYLERLKSSVADLKNIGGRPGGSITAALFLKEFVGDLPWAHLDIASTAYLSEGTRYLPKHGTGAAVRLLVEMLEAEQ